MKVHRVLGMSVFIFVLLVVGWYWEAGEWRLVPLNLWPYSGDKSLIVWLLRSLAEETQIWSIENNTDQWWLYTQPLVFLAGWALRRQLGNAVAKAASAI
ncbi:MAG TPA: hypothetical protein VN693_07415 [Rhodanobacteraceae bacterium]|nr:hypothetical protein [Rhodanobacteraceae bacterium]